MPVTASPVPAERWSENALRAAIRDALARALRIASDSIDDNTDFDALGLPSLEAVELTADLEDLIGRPVDAEAALEHATVARLAAHLRALLP